MSVTNGKSSFAFLRRLIYRVLSEFSPSTFTHTHSAKIVYRYVGQRRWSTGGVRGLTREAARNHREPCWGKLKPGTHQVTHHVRLHRALCPSSSCLIIRFRQQSTFNNSTVLNATLSPVWARA